MDTHNDTLPDICITLRIMILH